MEDTLDHLGAVNSIRRKYTIRTTVICLLLRAMYRHNCSFWAFSTRVWHELLGHDYYAYIRQHGATCNARQQLIAVAYLLCGFDELSVLGRLAYHLLAQKIFGARWIDPLVDDLLQDLQQWGYTRKGNALGLKNALA